MPWTSSESSSVGLSETNFGEIQIRKIFDEWQPKEKICKSVIGSLCAYLSRTTRTFAFWGYPLLPHDYPYYWPQFILDAKSKQDKVKVTNLKNLPKRQILWFWKKKLSHVTHLLKLLDKVCKYEMDPASIVEDTERTRFCPQMDRRTEGQSETSIPPFNLVELVFNSVFRYVPIYLVSKNEMILKGNLFNHCIRSWRMDWLTVPHHNMSFLKRDIHRLKHISTLL